MGVDFPRGWQITMSKPKSVHDEKCSYRTHSMLCDCHVLFKHPEFLDNLLHGKDGKPCFPEDYCGEILS